ncbi:MAG TPA: signal peptide peptidase SppA [Candidatus Xenobia bacterium]
MLGVLLALSLIFNIGALLVVAIAAGDEAPRYREVLVDGKEDEQDKIAVIPIHGVIEDSGDRRGESGHTAAGLHAILKYLDSDAHLKGIVLDVDSPGGGVTASDIMYHELKSFRQSRNIPIVALFGDVTASGGYYISMASNEIVAHPTTVTGSIGVISHFPNISGLMDKLGVKMDVVKSLNSTGHTSMKDIGSPYRPMTPAERQVFQDLVTQMWQRFVAVVQDGRKGHIEPDRVAALADGRVFTGADAQKLGLVDALGYAEDAYARARALAHADHARIVRIEGASRWFDPFGLAKSNMDPVDTLLSQWSDESPRVLYLWTGP